jgi:hypothetical protein
MPIAKMAIATRATMTQTDVPVPVSAAGLTVGDAVGVGAALVGLAVVGLAVVGSGVGAALVGLAVGSGAAYENVIPPSMG